MTNKEAIEYIKRIFVRDRANELHFISHDEEIALNLAVKALEDRPTGKWTPVSEELPKEDNDYLITYKSYGEDVVSRSWFNTRFGFIFDNVIAWMPLPQPYKKEAEE